MDWALWTEGWCAMIPVDQLIWGLDGLAAVCVVAGCALSVWEWRMSAPAWTDAVAAADALEIDRLLARTRRVVRLASLLFWCALALAALVAACAVFAGVQ